MALRKPPNKGAAALPKTVRNKMGFYKRGGSVPKNKALYSRVKSEAKKKFKVYPSAYANAWLVRTYKKRGGTYG
tara:strand:- start:594 stop:815 length:222 start_codon:yes stop_codon:yes gene_type:complete